MKWQLLPGYNDLFDDEGKTYEEWLEDIPSETVINVFIALNNKLDMLDTEESIQLTLKSFAYEELSVRQIVSYPPINWTDILF